MTVFSKNYKLAVYSRPSIGRQNFFRHNLPRKLLNFNLLGKSPKKLNVSQSYYEATMILINVKKRHNVITEPQYIRFTQNALLQMVETKCMSI